MIQQQNSNDNLKWNEIELYRIITVKLSFQAIKKAVQGRSIGRPIRASIRLDSNRNIKRETRKGRGVREE